METRRRPIDQFSFATFDVAHARERACRKGGNLAGLRRSYSPPVPLLFVRRCNAYSMMRVELNMNRQRQVEDGGCTLSARRVGLAAVVLPLVLLATGCGAAPPLRIASIGTPN